MNTDNYVTRFIEFVRNTLPKREGYSYLVYTPAAPNRSRCSFLARRKNKRMYYGIALPEKAQSAVTQYLTNNPTSRKLRDELFDWFSSLEAKPEGFVLKRVKSRTDVKGFTDLILIITDNEYNYSFYL